MANAARTPNKFHPPDTARIVPRERVFAALDRAFEKPIVWVGAPAGSGSPRRGELPRSP